jgi:hypothetical protein
MTREAGALTAGNAIPVRTGDAAESAQVRQVVASSPCLVTGTVS